MTSWHLSSRLVPHSDFGSLRDLAGLILAKGCQFDRKGHFNNFDVSNR
jgi:hypothetical protein